MKRTSRRPGTPAHAGRRVPFARSGRTYGRCVRGSTTVVPISTRPAKAGSPAGTEPATTRLNTSGRCSRPTGTTPKSPSRCQPAERGGSSARARAGEQLRRRAGSGDRARPRRRAALPSRRPGSASGAREQRLSASSNAPRSGIGQEPEHPDHRAAPTSAARAARPLDRPSRPRRPGNRRLRPVASVVVAARQHLAVEMELVQELERAARDASERIVGDLDRQLDRVLDRRVHLAQQRAAARQRDAGVSRGRRRASGRRLLERAADRRGDLLHRIGERLADLLAADQVVRRGRPVMVSRPATSISSLLPNGDGRADRDLDALGGLLADQQVVLAPQVLA